MAETEGLHVELTADAQSFISTINSAKNKLEEKNDVLNKLDYYYTQFTSWAILSKWFNSSYSQLTLYAFEYFGGSMPSLFEIFNGSMGKAHRQTS